MLQHLHLLVKSALFGKVTELISVRACQRLAKHRDVSRIGHDDPNDHPDRSGLARTIRPEQAINSASGDRQRQMIDGNELVVVLADAIELYYMGRSLLTQSTAGRQDRGFNRIHKAGIP